MVDPEALETFTDLGLTPSEARVYLTLLEAPGVRVAELARLADLPRSRAYAVLEALVARGIVNEIPAVYKRFEAMDARAAITHLLDARRQRLKRDAERADALATRLVTAGGTQRTATSTEGPRDPREQIMNAFTRVAARARGEVIACLRADDLPADAPGPHMRFLPGVDVRVIVDAECAHPFAHLPDADVRLRGFLPMTLAVADRETVILADPNGPDADDAAETLVLRNPRLAEILLGAFEATWATAEPVARNGKSPDDGACNLSG